MSDPRKEFREFYAEMDEAFAKSEHESHMEGDYLLRKLIDRLLQNYVSYTDELTWDAKKTKSDAMLYSEVILVRKALALYDGMFKWYS